MEPGAAASARETSEAAAGVVDPCIPELPSYRMDRKPRGQSNLNCLKFTVQTAGAYLVACQDSNLAEATFSLILGRSCGNPPGVGSWVCHCNKSYFWLICLVRVFTMDEHYNCRNLCYHQQC